MTPNRATFHLFSGIAAIHERAFVHRGVKPGNILIVHSTQDGHGVLKVSDFGSMIEAASKINEKKRRPGHIDLQKSIWAAVAKVAATCGLSVAFCVKSWVGLRMERKSVPPFLQPVMPQRRSLRFCSSWADRP